jgi:hypothetical protein
MHTLFWLETLDERDHFERPSTDGRVILQRMFKKVDGINFAHNRGPMVGYCEH